MSFTLRRFVAVAGVTVALVGTQRDMSALSETEVRVSRVSVLETGELVVSMDTQGALPGLLTARLVVSNGAIVGGEWSVVVTSVQDLNADGSVIDPHDHPATEPESGEPHQEYIRIVDRGTLAGRVTSGSVAMNADGSLVLSTVQLIVETGSLTFATVAAGYGELNLDQALTGAQGALRLEY